MEKFKRGKSVRLLLILIFAIFLYGCGGCDDDCGNGCEAGFECSSGLCVPVQECPGGCPEGLVCEEGLCTEPTEQCAVPGTACDPRRPVLDSALCLSFDGITATCMDKCTASGGCSTGSLCFFVESLADTGCTGDGDCEELQVCRLGGCRDTICRMGDCEGALAGQATCDALYEGDPQFPNGAICGEVGNGANFCFPAGPRAVGETCSTLDEGLVSGNIGNLCGRGLTCLGGECRVMCDGTSGCGGTEACLLVEENIAGDGVGFCGDSCEPFETGVCGPNRTCLPISADQGLCSPAGNLPAFAECDPGAAACSDGTTCIIVQSPNPTTGLTGEARCYPICDIRNAPTEIDGSVSTTNQALRDANCPNPPVDPTGVALVHLARSVGELDVYLGEALIGSFGPGERLGMGLLELAPSRLGFEFRPVGAPSSDAPLAEFALDAVSGRSYTIDVLAVADSTTEVLIRSRLIEPVSGSELAHAVADSQEIDVVAVPVDEEPGDDNQTILAEGLGSGERLPIDLIGEVDLLFYVAGAERTSRFDALLIARVELESNKVVYFSGSLAPLDSAPLEVVVLDVIAALPINESDRYVCAPLGNSVYGYCQQTCPSVANYGPDYCQGTRMACGPTYISGPDLWVSACEPVGSAQAGASCNPFGVAQCAAGLYCQEYGNAAPNFDPNRRGRCEELCASGGEFGCTDPNRECRQLTPQLEVGQCAVACDSVDFSDSMCPAGQNACLPAARLELEGVGNVVPVVREEPSYCSASGLLAPGDACSGADCVPTAECLYPRSPQSDFLFSLLSPYVGGAGLVPRCTLRCDPFDGPPCASGETCLFNYPYNADVGHCAPIVENVPPGTSCTRPGESCGPDSICLADPSGNLCFRFCQFEGADSNGVLTRSTCPTGMECAALVTNLGVCRDPR